MKAPLASTDAPELPRTSPSMTRSVPYTRPSDDVVAYARDLIAGWPPLTPAQVSLLAHAFTPAITAPSRKAA